MTAFNFRWAGSRLFVATAFVALCSFAFVPGGASYEVFLNRDRVLNEHLYGRKEAPTLPLTMSAAQDELAVTFSNCGKVDTKRKISLKDEKDKLLKEWNFSDSPDIKNQMVIRVNEITRFKDQSPMPRLVYSSKELTTDVHLVTLQLGSSTARKE